MSKNEEFYAEFKSAEHVPEKFTWKFGNQTMTVRKKLVLINFMVINFLAKLFHNIVDGCYYYYYFNINFSIFYTSLQFNPNPH